MKILFIYYDTGSSSTPRIGFGVAYLSGFLKKHDHNTKLCYVRSNSDINNVISKVKDWKPDVIAHSSTSSSFYSVFEIVKNIKNSFPEIFQICGGNHVSLFPDELLNIPELDAICVGYGEYPLLELVNALKEKKDYFNIQNIHFRHNNKYIKNTLRPFPKNLDEFIPCDRKLFIDELKRFNDPVIFEDIFGKSVQEFIFCRGCPFDCTYCSNHILRTLGSGKYVNYPSVKKCIEELVAVKKEFNMTGVAFHDDIFTLNKKWFKEFANSYKEKVSLPYVCNLRVKCFSEDDVKLLKLSNCKVAILGVESGNSFIRNDIMKKNINSKDIIYSFNLLHKYGIETKSQNMIGLPEETPGNFLDTIKLNAKILPNKAAVSIFYPYHGTKLYDKCVKENLINTKENTSKNFSERKDSTLKLPYFKNQLITFYVENFNRLIKYENLTNKVKLLKILFPLDIKNQQKIANLIKFVMKIKFR